MALVEIGLLSSVDKYRSLAAWQAAHGLVLLTLRATDAASHPRCYGLFDQMRRAAVSVEANIVEGYALGSTAQFRRHLRIALGSAAEAECLARVAGEVGYLPHDRVSELEELAGRVIRTVHGLIKTGLAHPKT
jgi:four helix bundle protein